MQKPKLPIPRIEIFTDGGCSPNPGVGGWGVLIKLNGKEIALNGCQLKSTNNRMELTAAIKALEYFKESKKLVVASDSQYVIKGITTWIVRWKNKNYKKIKNVELWQRLDLLNEFHDVKWYWVKAHDGHRENELADRLCQMAILKCNKENSQDLPFVNFPFKSKNNKFFRSVIRKSNIQF